MLWLGTTKSSADLKRKGNRCRKAETRVALSEYPAAEKKKTLWGHPGYLWSDIHPLQGHSYKKAIQIIPPKKEIIYEGPPNEWSRPVATFVYSQLKLTNIKSLLILDIELHHPCPTKGVKKPKIQVKMSL